MLHVCNGRYLIIYVFEISKYYLHLIIPGYWAWTCRLKVYVSYKEVWFSDSIIRCIMMGWWSVDSADTRQQKARQSSNYYFQEPMQQLKCTSALDNWLSSVRRRILLNVDVEPGIQIIILSITPQQNAEWGTASINLWGYKQLSQTTRLNWNKINKVCIHFRHEIQKSLNIPKYRYRQQ